MPDLKLIIDHANKMQSQAPMHQRLLDIYGGNLLPYAEKAISGELSAESAAISKKRIAVINLLERIINKLSKVYSNTPKRATADDSDQLIVEQYASDSDIQAVMGQAEVLLNLHKHFALEPYLSKGTFAVRVLAPHEFTVYSDDGQNPMAVTAFIKFMGKRQKSKGVVSEYWIYDDETFTIADSDGDIYEQQPNPYGMIPIVYSNADAFQLQPKPDNDTFNNTVLIPKLITDLNYSVAFMSRSVIYGIDLNVDGSKLVNSPDVMWNLKSDTGGNEKPSPSIGVLSPTVDVDKVLSLITFTVSEWLTSKGIRPGSVGSLQPQNAVSGVSKIVDEADTSQVVDKNRIMLVKAEKQLWKLISKIHNTLLPTDLLSIKNGLSENLDVSVSFAVQQPITDPAEKRNELKFQLDNKLISYTRALKQAHPDLSDQEIEKLKAEIDAENVTAPIAPTVAPIIDDGK